LRKSEKLATAGRLAASIAHEINNPLAGLANSLYLALQDDSLQPRSLSEAQWHARGHGKALLLRRLDPVSGQHPHRE
jgi:signal transduction histidine kinase